MGQIIDSLDQAVTSKVSEVLDLAVLERLLEDTSIDFLPSLSKCLNQNLHSA